VGGSAIVPSAADDTYSTNTPDNTHLVDNLMLQKNVQARNNDCNNVCKLLLII